MLKPERTVEETRLMVTLNQASLYDWLSRADCGDKERSIGYWQASRKALLQNGVEAKRRHHGGKTLNSMGPTHRSIRRGFTTLDNTFGHLVGRGPRWYMGASNRGESGPNQDKIWAQFARDFM